MKRLAAFARWAVSKEGRTEIGALAGIVGGIYQGLHRAGVL